MKTVKIDISLDDLETIELALNRMAGSPHATSHGPLDLPRLISMLLEDVALAMRRPGSWEGANMITVLQSHGYSI